MLPAKMHQLYKAIAIPKMLYRYDLTNMPICAKPGVKWVTGSVGFAKNLAVSRGLLPLP